FIEFGGGTVREPGIAASAGDAIAGRDLRRGQHTIVGDVIESADGLSMDISPGKESDGFEVDVRV
ncbi:MAG TPA: hypothetical protein VHZ99_14510, partial [Steroidobacteraceae bacterium]|nr:hypothetical protein [Steroidobacteraceae bacterium]